MSDENIVYGLCWYQPEQWDRLKEISSDRDDLEDTYEEWRRNANKSLSELRASGQVIKKVKINLEELLLWCNEQQLKINSHSRAGYASHVLQRTEK